MKTILKKFDAWLGVGLFFIASVMVLSISIVAERQWNRFLDVINQTTRDRLMSSAQALAKIVTAEELDRFHTAEDTLDPLYDEIRLRLVEFAEDHSLVYAYFWRLYDANTNLLQFIISNDMDPQTQIGPGDLFFESEEMTISALAGETGANNLGTYVPEWYGLISGWAPVFDADGNLSAVAAVDISDLFIFEFRRESHNTNILLVIIAIFVFTFLAVIDSLRYKRRAGQIEKANVALARERDINQAMKDNIHQGIFLMDRELNILPQYSRPLGTILSYCSGLEGKNLLDILAGSMDVRQLQALQKYFKMVFAKSKAKNVLEDANPLSEFEYKAGGRTKILSAQFDLVEQAGTEPVIVGVIQDITREKEYEMELQAQREAQQLEMKNMFDIIQTDPLEFQDYIDNAEAIFDTINSIFKDKSLTEKQAVTKIFQNIHAMKSNAFAVGLEYFGKKLHALEDEIKTVLAASMISGDDLLRLAVQLEAIMHEKDSYAKVVQKIDAYKTTSQIDSVLVRSLAKSAENIAAETQKKAELKAEQMDKSILKSKLGKPIKTILLQCVRNSVYHGIETPEERIRKNKRKQGLLVVSVKKANDNAEIIFSDDGRGLDWDKIKTRYLKRYPEVKDVSKKVLLSSIFLPEFSTSDEVTQAAGRGVGLSLVKDLVKENGGSIRVDTSSPGLTLKFIFPLAG